MSQRDEGIVDTLFSRRRRLYSQVPLVADGAANEGGPMPDRCVAIARDMYYERYLIAVCSKKGIDLSISASRQP